MILKKIRLNAAGRLKEFSDGDESFVPADHGGDLFINFGFYVYKGPFDSLWGTHSFECLAAMGRSITFSSGGRRSWEGA